MIQTDFQLFGILCLILGGIFYTSGLNSPFWRRCYRILPVMVACYFVPSLLNTMGLIAVKDSQLPKFAVDYLMPMCLVLMLLGLDIGSIWRCGGKLLLLFFIGSLGVFVGGRWRCGWWDTYSLSSCCRRGRIASGAAWRPWQVIGSVAPPIRWR
ncbi:DUF819 family protein [Shewanella algae]|nr:DUF819 family protein [Shewanella algae]